MKRVFHFVSSLEVLGGIESLVREYVSLSHNPDIEISCFLYEPSEKVHEQLNFLLHPSQQGKHSKKVEMTCPTGMKHKMQAFLFLYNEAKNAKLNIIEFVKDNEVDILHMHHTPLFLLHKIPKLFGYPKLYFTCHNEAKRIFSNSILGRYKKFRFKQLIKKNNLILVALHEPMRQELNEMFHINNTIIINNGIDMKRFSTDSFTNSKKQVIRKSLRIKEDEFIIGHIARFVPEKNHLFILDIFSMLLQKQENSKLLLIGDGPLKEDVLEKIDDLHLENNVLVLGNRADIPELLAIMDVFLFPSVFEGLSISLLEAQAMNVKCVVSTNVKIDSHLTKRYVSVDLDAPLEDWCDAILNDEISTTPNGVLKDYDMNDIVRNMEFMYLQNEPI